MKHVRSRTSRFPLATLSWIVCLSLIFCIFSPAVSSASPSRIKVLILDETYSTIPDKDEKITRLGNMKGDLLVNGTRYTGNIEVWRGEKGLYIINELPLEDYVESVVAAEVGTNWEVEALKAQAVIVRTYAVTRMKTNENARYHLTSSVLHQVYKGNNPQIQVAYAVRETVGEIVTYQGKPIEAFYHSTSGGMTEDPQEVFGRSYPYLKPVETTCEQSPYYVWERRIPYQEMEKSLDIKGIKKVAIASRTSTGRVKEVAIESDSGRKVIKATELRKLVGWSRLPSTNFDVSLNGDSAVFEGKGYGHGVGLCQWSALQMAKEGRDYREILSYFYPGTEIWLYEGE